MKYNNFQHSPPLVFLDTNVIIEMVDGLLSEDRNHRGSKLYEILQEKVTNNKILCPFVYQRDEYFMYFDETKKRMCDDILLTLSKGHQVRIVVEEIFNRQFMRIAASYLRQGNKVDEFNFDSEDIFDSKSCRASKAETDLGIRVTVLRTGHRDPDRDVIEPNLLKLLGDRRERIRRAGLTKQEIYEEERRGRLLDLKLKDEERIKNYSTNLNPNSNILHEMSLGRTKRNIIESWQTCLREAGVSDDDFSKLTRFIHSEYFFDIPIDHVSSVLYTEILFGNQIIEITDHRDISALSVVFPYATYAIVDKRMRSYLYQANLPNTYNVQVYGLDSLKKFITQLPR